MFDPENRPAALKECRQITRWLAHPRSGQASETVWLVLALTLHSPPSPIPVILQLIPHAFCTLLFFISLLLSVYIPCSASLLDCVPVPVRSSPAALATATAKRSRRLLPETVTGHHNRYADSSRCLHAKHFSSNPSSHGPCHFYVAVALSLTLRHLHSPRSTYTYTLTVAAIS